MDTCHECINIVEKLNEEFDTLQDENTELKKKIVVLEDRLKVFEKNMKIFDDCVCPSSCIKCMHCNRLYKRRSMNRHMKVCRIVQECDIVQKFGNGSGQ